MSVTKMKWLMEYLNEQYGSRFTVETAKQAEKAYNEAHPCKTDYTGCHPEIAESLKRGEHVEKALVGYTEKELCMKRKIIAYVDGFYRTLDKYGDAGWYKHAKPLPKTEKRVIGRVPMMQGFEANGWILEDHGTFTKDGEKPHGIGILTHSGKKPYHQYHYEPWMIEEVEIDDK